MYLRIILVYSVFSTLTNPLWISVLATGKLKRYQLYDNIVQAAVLPVSYIAFKYFHAASYWVFLILLISEIIEIVIRAWIVLPLINHKYMVYIREVAVPLVLVSLTAPLIPFILSNNLVANDVVRFFAVCIVSVLCSMLAIWVFGLRENERSYFTVMIKSKILRK